MSIATIAAIATIIRRTGLAGLLVVAASATAVAQSGGEAPTLEGFEPRPAPTAMEASAARRADRRPAAPGELAAEEDTRVYGGTLADRGEYPYQVAVIQFAPDGKGYGLCGGSIIDRQWILTAAHCAADNEGTPATPQQMLVEIGTTRLQEGVQLDVAEVIVHPDYTSDWRGLEHDVALLKLREPIGATAVPVGGIRIAPTGYSPEPGPAIVTGWGQTDEADDINPMDLREAELQIVARDVCNAGWVGAYAEELAGVLVGVANRAAIDPARFQSVYDDLTGAMNGPITENMVCAGVPSGERTACHGDSGGPLVVRQADGGLLQVGVVSWGHKPVSYTPRMPCGMPNTYGVFVNLANYFDWIAGHVRGG